MPAARAAGHGILTRPFGIDDSEPCAVGTLHTRSAELAIALAAAIEEPSSSALAERATSALEALLAELAGHRLQTHGIVSITADERR